jgi:hypothetical protein
MICTKQVFLEQLVVAQLVKIFSLFNDTVFIFPQGLLSQINPVHNQKLYLRSVYALYPKWLIHFIVSD